MRRPAPTAAPQVVTRSTMPLVLEWVMWAGCCLGFAYFVASGAWADPRFRLPDAPPPQRPPDWERQVRHPNCPVWGVDWWDAVAFCAWASTTWRLPSGGRHVTLPSAAMWEAAARGPKGDPFPWGKEEDTGQGDTARAAHNWRGGPLSGAPSVGAFPRGDRGRLMDLAGNV